PFLSEEEARRLGATKASLEQVMGCPVISVHAPTLPETEGMITKEHLRMIPDGAFLINSSRASVIDEAALITELKTGRFRAALDVYTKEPLPASSPLLSLENVLLTPHIAGHAVEGHQGLMEAVVSDILAAIEGRPTRYEVKKDVWQRIA
ncbi:MAG TPA: NAD(P)-dependent oxidoreductase, partial [Spirochaetia bacterium]|nr:NAD(P)-dependent oxidoreductase [Spirochaetia bacterium]